MLYVFDLGLGGTTGSYAIELKDSIERLPADEFYNNFVGESLRNMRATDTARMLLGQASHYSTNLMRYTIENPMFANMQYMVKESGDNNYIRGLRLVQAIIPLCEYEGEAACLLVGEHFDNAIHVIGGILTVPQIILALNICATANRTPEPKEKYLVSGKPIWKCEDGESNFYKSCKGRNHLPDKFIETYEVNETKTSSIVMAEGAVMTIRPKNDIGYLEIDLKETYGIGLTPSFRKLDLPTLLLRNWVPKEYEPSSTSEEANYMAKFYKPYQSVGIMHMTQLIATNLKELELALQEKHFEILTNIDVLKEAKEKYGDKEGFEFIMNKTNQKSMYIIDYDINNDLYDSDGAEEIRLMLPKEADNTHLCLFGQSAKGLFSNVDGCGYLKTDTLTALIKSCESKFAKQRAKHGTASESSEASAEMSEAANEVVSEPSEAETE